MFDWLFVGFAYKYCQWFCALSLSRKGNGQWTASAWDGEHRRTRNCSYQEFWSRALFEIHPFRPIWLDGRDSNLPALSCWSCKLTSHDHLLCKYHLPLGEEKYASYSFILMSKEWALVKVLSIMTYFVCPTRHVGRCAASLYRLYRRKESAISMCWQLPGSKWIRGNYTCSWNRLPQHSTAQLAAKKCKAEWETYPLCTSSMIPIPRLCNSIVDSGRNLGASSRR